MRLLARIFLIFGLCVCAACTSASGTAQAGGGDNGGYGSLHLGIPF